MSQLTRLEPSAPLTWHWRREVLCVAYAVMEICWITPLFLVLIAPARPMPAYLAALVLASLLFLFFYLARLAERWIWNPGRGRALMLLALPSAILVSWRIFLHPHAPMFDLGWLKQAGADMALGRAGGHWAVMIAVLFLWWRGIVLSRRSFVFSSVAFAFRSGLLLLALGAALLSLITSRQYFALIYLFFFASLLAVALTRLEEVGALQGEAGRAFDLFWIALLISAIAILLGAGLLLALAGSPQGLKTIAHWWAPIGNGLLRAMMLVMALILAPFEPLLTWLVELLSDLWRALLSEDLALALANLPIIPGQSGDASDPAAIYLAAAWTAVRLLCGASLLAVLVIAGLWWLKKQRDRQPERAEELDSLDSGLLDSLGDLMRRGRKRLRQAVDLVGSLGVGRGLLAAVSVRAIYANMARLARQRGYPRQTARTPYEYLPDLLAAFPAAQDEAQAITEAYVAVHYGELPVSRAELAELRAAYERLRLS
jgi:hypothetical protein